MLAPAGADAVLVKYGADVRGGSDGPNSAKRIGSHGSSQFSRHHACPAAGRLSIGS